MAVNSYDQIISESERVRFPEQMLGKCLNQPNTWSNAGARKILFSTQYDQRLPLIHPEVPLVSTGYENQYGEASSSFKVTSSEYSVLKKIKKYSFVNDDYYLIVKNTDTNEIGVIERKSYSHNTESYGYLNDCSYLDSLQEGEGIIPKGTVYQKSTGFDEYNNRQDGVNLLTIYLANDKTKEDGIIISESAAKKLSVPLFKRVTITINDNDIPLNLYGNDQVYKFLPDIGEKSDGLLCGIRREKKEESLYTQSFHMLRQILMSDDKYTESGKVIDIDIACNNPEKLKNSVYSGQLAMYYDESMRFASEVVRFVSGYEKMGYKFSHDLQVLYDISKEKLNGTQFVKDGKLFSNIIIEVTLLQEYPMGVGDKLTNRYGGKGVVSAVRPDYLMPILDNGKTIEVIYNQNTSINRCNPSQQIEMSINFQTDRLLEVIGSQVFDASTFIEMYLDYINILSPELHDYLQETISQMSDEDMMIYLDSLAESGVMVSLRPIVESVNMDKLEKIYDKFPFIKPYKMSVPMVSSTGEVRYIDARREVIAGKQYIYRLKQYAEDKFSVTSLSSTNMKNENCRSRTNKEHKAPYSKTPIQFGNMETGDLGHMGMETVIINLMIYSVSPKARRLCEQMLTGNPFDTNIRLDSEASNRSVEILNAYLKSMGYEIIFKKRLKSERTPIMINPMQVVPGIEEPSLSNLSTPMVIYDKLPPNYVINKELEEAQCEIYLAERNGMKRPMKIYPIRIIK